MEISWSPPRIGLRSIPLLLVGLIAGAFVLSPAVGEAAAFLTKKKADRRYLGNNTVVTAQKVVLASDGGTIDVLCPSGRQATGGGVDSPNQSLPTMDYTFIDESKPILSGARSIGWNVEVVNNTSAPLQFTAYAVCAS